MLKPSPLRSLSTTQLIVLAVVGIIALFLIIGTVTQSTAPEPQFSLGLETQPFAVLALLAFAGGVLSFASPCTLPILPAYFAFAFQSGRKQIAANTLAFMLGLATMFSLLGAGASVLGRVLQQNTELLLLIGGSVIVIFGVMSLLGKGFAGVETGQAEARSTTLGGSYAFGLTFAVGWTSCVGPILGVVLTLAATAGSVGRGVMLLFIYAIGLGLPLLLVSTFFGRADRNGLFWRALRGRGWRVTVPTLVVGLVWALALWRIAVAVLNYALTAGWIAVLPAGELTLLQEFGVLVVVFLAVALWIFTSGEAWQTTLRLHSTQLISGGMFVLLGLLMLDGTLAQFNNEIPADLALWFADFEDMLIGFFIR